MVGRLEGALLACHSLTPVFYDIFLIDGPEEVRKWSGLG
jgi:hypothetical protein